MRIFRIVHIQNIPHILIHGITHVNSANANPNFVSIGNTNLISKRNTFICPNGRRFLSLTVENAKNNDNQLFKR
jgi:hypothetical protein